MSDLNTLFLKGIEFQSTYEPFKVMEKLNKYNELSADHDDDGANWEIILQHIETDVFICGFLSRYYPVALLKRNCPEYLINELNNNNIFIGFFDEPFSCDEIILKKYAPDKRILDDRFLDNEDFSLDDERLFYIYENISYVRPYSFMFDEIR